MLCSTVFAGSGLSFLEIPVGARESALGGAGASISSGPTSVAYNPAATAFTRRISVALMHNRHFGDTRAEFLGATILPGRFVATLHYLGTRTSDVEYRTAPTRLPISTFDVTSSALGATLATNFGARVGAGLTVRYVYQKIQSEATDGALLDGGVLVRTPLSGVAIGAAVNSVGKMSNFVNEEPKLPTTLRVGVAFERELGKAGGVLVTTDVLGISEQSPQLRGGMEWKAPDYVALRVGAVNGLEAQTASFGFGLFLKRLRLDYAFIPFTEGLDDGHRFSLAFDL